MRDGRWLEPLRRGLDAAEEPRLFFFRDDDAGWASGRLLALVDVFTEYAVPLDLAVIPAALDAELAATLAERREKSGGLLAFHQHGYAHANHEPTGRPCEFGPARPASAQRRDIAAGAERLRALVGSTTPVFTPPWNRCTDTTGRCLLDLGFRALARDSTADRLDLPGLEELDVHVDWSGAHDRHAELGALLAATLPGPTGIMLHHALLGRGERRDVTRFLDLLATHPNARCVTLSSLLVARISAPV